MAPLPPIHPKDNISIVAVASDSAELTCGKNLRYPYQTKINPMLNLRNKIPFDAIQRVNLRSS
jgi:hypothetical protein